MNRCDGQHPMPLCDDPHCWHTPYTVEPTEDGRYAVRDVTGKQFAVFGLPSLAEECRSAILQATTAQRADNREMYSRYMDANQAACRASIELSAWRALLPTEPTIEAAADYIADKIVVAAEAERLRDELQAVRAELDAAKSLVEAASRDGVIGEAIRQRLAAEAALAEAKQQRDGWEAQYVAAAEWREKYKTELDAANARLAQAQSDL